MKSFIIDRRYMFFGSFNWDPRSAYINTELGVIIKSDDIAGTAAAAVDQNIGPRSYEVKLDDKGRLRWHGENDGKPVVLTKEPDTTWWDRFSAGMMRILSVQSQL